jgi:single-strand selective monofunctional uracil DNA glycosylase
MSLVTDTEAIAREIGKLRFSAPVAFVYHPLDYAWDVHRRWLERYGGGRKQVLLVGMNPGPFGMVQTGVPFGEVAAVRDWMKLHGEVRQPARAHPKRPVQGLACCRSEVSGKRLWGWARGRFGTPHHFFRRFFVHNYCPLAFVGESGVNLTPDKLDRKETAPLFEMCDQLLRATVAATRPGLVVGVGAFAEQRARKVLGETVRIGRIPHPSPASPAANRGWDGQVDAALRELGALAGESA